MGAVVVQVIGSAVGLPAPTGQYLQRYDPDAEMDVDSAGGWSLRRVGGGWAEFTADPMLAQKFPNAVEAWRCWVQSPAAHPTRADGKPNRPLTAFHIAIVPLEDVEEVT